MVEVLSTGAELLWAIAAGHLEHIGLHGGQFLLSFFGIADGSAHSPAG
jgi:hypothetical protein